MPVEYSEAPDVAAIANDEVIPNWHEHLTYLPIRYEFASSLPDKNGRIILAKTKKATPMEEYLSGARLFVIVDKMRWAMLSPAQRTALVDHELSHVVQDKKNGGFKMQGHDLEEFIGVVQRHGAWTFGLQEFLYRTQNAQMELFRDIEDGKVVIQETVEEVAEKLREDIEQGKSTVTLSVGGKSTTIHPTGAEVDNLIEETQGMRVNAQTGEVEEE